VLDVVLDVGCWMLDVGCWMLDVGCWMLDVGVLGMQDEKYLPQLLTIQKIKPADWRVLLWMYFSNYYQLRYNN
jgi:hypothetical protein